MSRAALALLTALLASSTACEQGSPRAATQRTEAVEDAASPSLLTEAALSRALDALTSRAGTRALRLEVHANEVVLQAEDPKMSGAVLEYHYRDGGVHGPERAVLRGKGDLATNLFSLGEARLSAISELARAAVQRIDAEAGAVDYVLLRRNLPESDAIRFRVYVASPVRSGHVDADADGQLLAD